MMRLNTLFCGLFILGLASTAQAVKVEGTFKAVKTCPAYQSFAKGQNPGDIHTNPGREYEVVEENKANGPWALILIPELDNPRRWVAKECGIVNITGAGGDSHPETGGCHAANTYDSFVLALTWQAGFCEHYSYSGSKPECDNLNSGKIAVTNITIHGLWPNKKGCGTGYCDCSKMELDLEDDTISKIAPWMPNWYYADDFGKHEWSKHGTCQKLADDEYFLLMQRLAEKFDQSALGEYMRENIGRSVKVSDMESYLNTRLGEEVTKKFELRCTGDGKRYINEFWINLPGELNESGTLTELVSGGRDEKKFGGNCAETIYIEAPGPN